MNERRLTPDDLDRIEKRLQGEEEPEIGWYDYTVLKLVTEIRRTWDDLRRAMAYLPPPPSLPSSPVDRVLAESSTPVDVAGTGVEYHEVIRWEGEGGRPVE